MPVPLAPFMPCWGPWSISRVEIPAVRNRAGVCKSPLLRLTSVLSLLPGPAPSCEVPSCRPLWRPVCSAAFLPTSPHDRTSISGAAPQTLPQTHLLLQVRSDDPGGGGAQGLPPGYLRQMGEVTWLPREPPQVGPTLGRDWHAVS